MPSAVAASATEKVRFCFAAGGVSSPEAVLSSGTGQDRNQSVRSGLAAVLVAGRFRVCCLSCAEHSRRSGPGSGARPAVRRLAALTRGPDSFESISGSEVTGLNKLQIANAKTHVAFRLGSGLERLVLRERPPPLEARRSR